MAGRQNNVRNVSVEGKRHWEKSCDWRNARRKERATTITPWVSDVIARKPHSKLRGYQCSLIGDAYDLLLFVSVWRATTNKTRRAKPMAIDATPAAQRRRLSRFPGPSPRPRPGSQLAVPSTPAATPPPSGPRKSRLSALIYSPPDSTTSSPSLSAPPPFEWDAVRSNATPLYGPPGKPAKINAATGSPMRTPKKRIFRKANIIERFVRRNLSPC